MRAVNDATHRVLKREQAAPGIVALGHFVGGAAPRGK